MKEYIHQTLTDLRSKIYEFQCLEMALVAAFGAPEGADLVDRSPQPKPLSAKPKPAARVKSPANKVRRHPDELRSIALRYKGPFTVAMLQTDAGLSFNGASSQCLRWLAKGLVERVAKGTYLLTAKFPKPGGLPTVVGPRPVIGRTSVTQSALLDEIHRDIEAKRKPTDS